MRYLVVFLAVLVVSCATPNPTESSSRGGKETVTYNDADTLIVDGDSSLGECILSLMSESCLNS
jgi:hypothetical protein